MPKQKQKRSREQKLTDRRQWYAANRDQLLEKARAYRKAHREQHLEYNRRWNRENPEKAKNTVLKTRFNITKAQYDAMVVSQGGVCGLCGRPETYKRYGQVQALAVDHDHKCCMGNRSCGRCIRGLLCRDCNVAIGLLGHSPTLLTKAAKWVERYDETKTHATEIECDNA